jgi:hypothetical protein
MAAVQAPPPLLEKRSDERQVFFLINWLRRQLLALQDIGGATIFSTRFNINPVGPLPASSAEAVLDQIELPLVLPSFQFIFAGQAKTVSGTSHFYLRAGGGNRTVDGDIFATLTVTSTGFVRYSASGTYSNPNLYTRVKLTGINAGANVQTQLEDHVLVIN